MKVKLTGDKEERSEKQSSKKAKQAGGEDLWLSLRNDLQKHRKSVSTHMAYTLKKPWAIR